MARVHIWKLESFGGCPGSDVTKTVMQVVPSFTPPLKNNYQLFVDKAPLRKSSDMEVRLEHTPVPESKTDDFRRVRGVAAHNCMPSPGRQRLEERPPLSASPSAVGHFLGAPTPVLPHGDYRRISRA